MTTNYTTGINISGSSVEWTTLRVGQDDLELQQSNTEPLKECGELPSILQQHQKDVIVGGLSAGITLTHVFNLPSTNPAEIAGMVELQVDKISPYPLQQLIISYEILAQGETHTRVLATGVRREIIETLGIRLESAGLILNSLDLDLLCRWDQLILADKIEAEAGEAVLIIEKGEAGLIIAEHGKPILFRTLPTADSTEELLAELEYSLTTLEQEFYLQGLDRMDIWDDESLPELTQSLNNQESIPVAVHNLTELPPLSEALARRYHRREIHHLELVPAEWIETAKNKALMRKLYKFGAIALVAWLALLLLFSGAFSMHKHQANKLQNAADELAGPAQAVQESSRRMNALISYTDQSQSALESLREISTQLPAGIDLLAFNYKKGTALTLRGEAESSDAVYKFFDTLAQSEFFKEIKDQRVNTTTKKSRRVSQFSLTAIPKGVE